jgi:hypothetical protein
MNEYLGRNLSFGAPGFTDVFENDKERQSKYQDTPLSPNGIQLVKEQFIHRGRPAFLDNQQDCNKDPTPPDQKEQQQQSTMVDLVVVSPLRRALQTFDLGLRPHLEHHNVPVVALPYAAERLYLISDVGTLRKD